MVQGDDQEIHTKTIMGLRAELGRGDSATNGNRRQHATWENGIRKGDRGDH